MNRRKFFRVLVGGTALALAPAVSGQDENKKIHEVWDTDFLYADITRLPTAHPKFIEKNKDYFNQKSTEVHPRCIAQPYLDGKPLFNCQWANAETGEAQITVNGTNIIVKGKVQLFINNKSGLITSKPSHFEDWITAAEKYHGYKLQ